MNYIKSEIQTLRNSPLSEDIVNLMLQATTNIAMAKSESRNTPLKKLFADVMLIYEIRYINAYYMKDYSHKDIIFAFYAGSGNEELCSQISLLQKCADYAEKINDNYKILPATDFLKINEALIKNAGNILDKHIDGNLSVLVSETSEILNSLYSPESLCPALLRLALAWRELEHDAYSTPIHMFVKELLLNFAFNNAFEINHSSLFIAKQILIKSPKISTAEEYAKDFIYALSNAAFDKLDIIINLAECMSKIQSDLKEKLPKIYSDSVLDILGDNILLNNEIAEKSLNVSLKTAILYLKQLEEIGILKSQRVGRELYYINAYVLDCIEKDFR